MNLQRFVGAQEGVYETAVQELRAGRKKSHWMWFVFPQLKGLGKSSTAEHYGIADLAEAKAYLDHPVLGARLREITAILLHLPVTDARAVFGTPDDLKLRSCLTLFAQVNPTEHTVFHETLELWFNGTPDVNTLELLYGKSGL